MIVKWGENIGRIMAACPEGAQFASNFPPVFAVSELCGSSNCVQTPGSTVWHSHVRTASNSQPVLAVCFRGFKLFCNPCANSVAHHTCSFGPAFLGVPVSVPVARPISHPTRSPYIQNPHAIKYFLNFSTSPIASAQCPFLHLQIDDAELRQACLLSLCSGALTTLTAVGARIGWPFCHFRASERRIVTIVLCINYAVRRMYVVRRQRPSPSDIIPIGRLGLRIGPVQPIVKVGVGSAGAGGRPCKDRFPPVRNDIIGAATIKMYRQDHL
jgi:hypothetical protein